MRGVHGRAEHPFVTGNLELAAKLAAVAVGALTLIGGTVIGAANLGVAGVRAEVQADRARVQFLESARVEDRKDAAEDRITLKRIEGKGDAALGGVEVLRRRILQRAPPPPDTPSEHVPWAQESVP